MATCCTLDLLDAEHSGLNDDGDDVNADPQTHRVDDDELQRSTDRSTRELFVVHGETTGSSRSRMVVSKKTRRPTSTRSSRKDGGNQSADAAGALRSSHANYEDERRGLQEELEQTRRELAHTREEREELRAAFQRLDQEIVNGYNLTERKEKKLKIAELLTKNQKLSQMLEKELKSQEALRTANSDLQSQIQQLEEQRTLLNRVLTSVEVKHAVLVEAHDQLTANHAAAQKHIADQQAAIERNETRDLESVSQRDTGYDQKLQLWESKCAEFQRNLDDKSVLLRAEQDKNKIRERTCEKLLEEKAALEREVTDVHDKMIRMNGALKAMEATIEASSAGSHEAFVLERMKDRVRVLEEETLAQNRLIGDLKRTVNDLLLNTGRSQNGVKRRFDGGASNSTNTSDRLVTLTQRLRKAEESRDQKSQCLGIFLAIIPHLLQQLDALQDKFHATVESNTILSNAVEQLQSNNQVDEQRNEPAIALAREGYVLSGPYQPELLMGFTMSRALSEVAPPPPRKQSKFMPFHVRTRVNISSNGPGQGELVLAADADDASGVTFLNRCRINAFLHFVQGNAAKAKCKHLLVQKIADLLTAQRDLMYNHSSESGYYKASVAKLDIEVRQRAKQLAEMQNEVERLQDMSDGNAMVRRTRLLLKVVEAVTDRSDQQTTTFLTQSNANIASDLLIAGDTSTIRAAVGWDVGASLNLSDCGVGDEDLEPLLLKISVSLVPVTQLDLCENSISDNGAATIAAFLESCPPSLKVIDLRGNSRISSDGVSRLRSGLVKNPRSCRVDMNSARNMLTAVAADQEYDTAGRSPAMLEIYLPEPTQEGDHEQDTKIGQMIHVLESRGFSGAVTKLTKAATAYRSTRSLSASKSSVTDAPRRGPSKVPPSTAGRKGSRGLHAQHEKKFRALEAAFSWDETSTLHTAARETKLGITLSQMQYLLQNSRSTIGSTSTMSAQRLAKLHFAQSHLATIRGLGKK